MFTLEFFGEVKREETIGTWGYPTEKTAWLSFWHSASVWQTGRRTDGRIYCS